MSTNNKLQHPFALMAQGFIAGAIIFYPATPSDTDVQQLPPTSSASVMPS